jgi:la-related protein 1
MSTAALEEVNKEGATQSQHALSSDTESPSASHGDAHPHQESQKDEIAQLPNGRKASSDDSTTPASQDQENRNVNEKKSRDGEDDWEKVSVPSLPAAEAQYKAAPIPSVNIWQVRIEAQAAKKKDIHTPIVPSAPNQSRKSRSASEDFKRKPISKEVPRIERESKNIESTTTSHRKDMPSARPSRPASQHGERADGDAPPPVIDTNSWPTPENSTFDDRRKSASYERSEKPDAKPAPQKSHGNKWVAVPFVPTAKFETQLPPAAARRGGRGGIRGGRDAGGRGGGYAGASAEKQDASTSMGPPPLPRQSGEQDRGRRPDGQQGVRGASVPTSSTRPASGDGPVSTYRRSNAVDHKDQSAPENAAIGPAAVQLTGEDQATRTEHSSRSSSRHTGNNGNRRVNGERNTPIDQSASGVPQSKEPTLKYSVNTERNNKTPATGSSRGNGDIGRDRGPGKSRDWSRDKPESAREKVESWRDRESSGDQGSRRGGRSERGRGNYRGRGEHSYNPPFTSSHAYTSPLPQNGFEPPSRSTSHTEARSRQASQPFVPTQATSTPRTNPRSQSIPVGMMFPGYYNGMPAVPQQGLASIQTDMSMYGYPSQMQMQPSIMSAMPYNDPLNSYALLSMVMTQM